MRLASGRDSRWHRALLQFGAGEALRDRHNNLQLLLGERREQLCELAPPVLFETANGLGGSAGHSKAVHPAVGGVRHAINQAVLHQPIHQLGCRAWADAHQCGELMHGQGAAFDQVS